MQIACGHVFYTTRERPGCTDATDAVFHRRRQRTCTNTANAHDLKNALASSFFSFLPSFLLFRNAHPFRLEKKS